MVTPTQSNIAEHQSSFEEHPEQGPMMKAALALASIEANRAHIEQIYTEQRNHVATARTNGATWRQIGDALGITRSAAQKYYGG